MMCRVKYNNIVISLETTFLVFLFVNLINISNNINNLCFIDTIFIIRVIFILVVNLYFFFLYKQLHLCKSQLRSFNGDFSKQLSKKIGRGEGTVALED